eukprot:COSAG02_NODE_5958_length_3912_cov_2.499082_1_plen_67_part_00
MHHDRLSQGASAADTGPIDALGSASQPVNDQGGGDGGVVVDTPNATDGKQNEDDDEQEELLGWAGF